MVKRYLLLALLLPAPAPALAAPAADRLVLETAATEDSDGLRQHSLYAGAVKALPAQGERAAVGLRAGYWQLEGGGDRVDFTALRLDYRRDLGFVDLDLGLHQLFGHVGSPTLGRVSASAPFAPLTLAAGVERELVDTVMAARAGTLVDTWHASLDHAATPEWTLVGAAVLQEFSDGNRRKGGVARLVYSPEAIAGFNAELRLRRLDGDRRAIGYFSPGRFEEGMLLLQYGHALPGERFVLTGRAGGGQQRIDGSATHAVFLAELRARGWYGATLGLEGRVGCTNTGELTVAAAGSGYRYCYGNLTLLRPW